MECAVPYYQERNFHIVLWTRNHILVVNVLTDTCNCFKPYFANYFQYSTVSMESGTLHYKLYVSFCTNFVSRYNMILISLLL